jgi:hypothetical protein
MTQAMAYSPALLNGYLALSAALSRSACAQLPASEAAGDAGLATARGDDNAGCALPRVPRQDLFARQTAPRVARTGIAGSGRRSAVRQYWPEPGHHPPATPPPTPPRSQDRHQPEPPATFRLTVRCPQPWHSRAATIGDLDPDHAIRGTDRDRDRLPRSARAAVPDAVPEQLTSSAASSPHGCPGPSTPAVNARATRARSARPATVTLSRTAGALCLIPGAR